MRPSIKKPIILTFAFLLLFSFFMNYVNAQSESEIEELIEQLKYHDKPIIRKDAIDALTKIGKPVVDLLIKKMNGTNYTYVRKGIIEVLGNIGDPGTIDFFINELKRLSSDDELQDSVKALCKIGEPAVEPLINALENQDFVLRRGAATTLGCMGNKRAIKPLINVLGDDRQQVRKAVAYSLDKLGWMPENNQEKTNYFIAKERWDECAEVGRDAIEPLISVFKGYHEDRSRAVGALTKIGEPAVIPLIAALNDKNRGVRLGSVEFFINIKDNRAAEMLIKTLNDEDGEIRTNSARALGNIGDKRVIKDMVVSLKDKDDNVRKAVADSLDKLGWIPENDTEKVFYYIARREWEKCVTSGVSAVEPLLTVIDDGYIQKDVKGILVKIGKLAVKPLITALKDKNIRWPVIEILGEIGDVRAKKALIDIVEDTSGDNSRFRLQALIALDKIGIDDNIMEVLVRAIKSNNNNDFQNKAFEVLGKMGEPALKFLIDLANNENIGIKEGAIFSLFRVGKPAVNILIDLIKDKDSKIRRTVVYALGNMGDNRANKPLVILLSDENGIIRKAAADSLDKLGWITKDNREKVFYLIAKKDLDACVNIGDASVEPLILSLRYEDNDLRNGIENALSKIGRPAVELLISSLKNDNPNVRKGSASALGNINDSQAVDPLINALSDEDAYVRWGVVVALGKIGDERSLEPLKKKLDDEDNFVRQEVIKSIKEIENKNK